MRKKLKEIRKSKSLTQSQVAKMVGIKRSTFTNIELGHKNPSFEVARKIKESLNYQGDDIFCVDSVDTEQI